MCVPALYLNIKKILLWEGWSKRKTDCFHQSICLIYFRTNKHHCCSCQGHHQVWALAIPPKLGHHGQRGVGGAPLARLSCISNSFNNHEHKREEDTLKWVKKCTSNLFLHIQFLSIILCHFVYPSWFFSFLVCHPNIFRGPHMAPDSHPLIYVFFLSRELNFGLGDFPMVWFWM